MWRPARYPPVLNPRGRPLRRDRAPPLALMTPSLFIELGLKPFRQARVVVIAHIANGARHAGPAAGAGVLAFPGLIGMVLANPAAVLAYRAFHSASYPIGGLGHIDVTAVNVAALRVVAIERLAARTRHKRTLHLRRRPLASIPSCIFPLGPIPLLAPRLKINLTALRQEHLPCALKIGARPIEGDGRSVGILARFATRVETANPSPRVFMVRNADADRYRADVYVSVIGVPAFLSVIFRSAAGEGGHAL
jgi:hypothetical protein